MQRETGCYDASFIARYDGVDPIVIDVTVEDFKPCPGHWESYGVVIPDGLGEGCNYDYVLPALLQPSVEGYYAVLVVHMKWIDVLSAQSGIFPAQLDKVLSEAEMVHHSRITPRIKTSPPD